MLPNGDIVSDQEVWEAVAVELWRRSKVALHAQMEEEKRYRERVLIPRLSAGGAPTLRDILTGEEMDMTPDAAYNDAHPSCAVKRARVRYHLSGYEKLGLDGACTHHQCIECGGRGMS